MLQEFQNEYAVITDTSCFILLSNIDELSLLHKVYGEIITTPQIAREFGGNLPDWVKVKSPADYQKQQILELLMIKVKQVQGL